ncbi:MAG: hypothetical protein ACI9MR_004628 [Myxococcota bacterium]|jgi:hypothetical protein
MNETVSAGAWRRLNAAIDEVAPGPLWDTLSMIRLATHVRMGHDGAAAALAQLDVKTRLTALELITTNVPPTPETAKVARDTIFQVEEFKLLSDRAIAVWSGMSVKDARWSETNSFDRIRALGRVVASGVPADIEGMNALLDQLEHDVEVEAGVAAWFAERPFDGHAASLALLARAKRPGAQMEAIGAIIGREDVDAAQATSWLDLADAAIAAAPAGNRDALVGRKAALLSLAGRADEAAALWPMVLERCKNVSNTVRHAPVYRALVNAAAVCGYEAWQGVVESVAGARAYLHDPESYHSVRAACIRSLGRAVRSVDHVDRGNQTFRELTRRIPNGWLTLLHQATVTELAARWGRSPEPWWTVLETLLGKKGMPRPGGPIVVEEVVAPLVRVDGPRALALGDGLPSPLQRALWAVALITTFAS